MAKPTHLTILEYYSLHAACLALFTSNSFSFEKPIQDKVFSEIEALQQEGLPLSKSGVIAFSQKFNLPISVEVFFESSLKQSLEPYVLEFSRISTAVEALKMVTDINDPNTTATAFISKYPKFREFINTEEISAAKSLLKLNSL